MIPDLWRRGAFRPTTLWRIQRVDPSTHRVLEVSYYRQIPAARRLADKWQHLGWDVRISRADNVAFILTGTTEDD